MVKSRFAGQEKGGLYWFLGTALLQKLSTKGSYSAIDSTVQSEKESSDSESIQ